jgi:ribosomal protein L14
VLGFCLLIFLTINKKAMKKLTLLFLLCFGCLTMQAQEKQKHKEKMSKDCVMMEDGKMMSMMGGTTTAMDKDMTMKNGTVVMTDGTVKMKDGKTMMLKDGDCVMMDGTVKHMGTKNKNKMKGKAS